MGVSYNPALREKHPSKNTTRDFHNEMDEWKCITKRLVHSPLYPVGEAGTQVTTLVIGKRSFLSSIWLRPVATQTTARFMTKLGWSGGRDFAVGKGISHLPAPEGKSQSVSSCEGASRVRSQLSSESP